MPLLNPLIFKYQGLDYVHRTPIVQNVWYPEDLTAPMKFMFLEVMQENTGADPADLEVRVTVEDRAPMVLAYPAAISGTWYAMVLDVPTETLLDAGGDQPFFLQCEGERRPLECSHILIEIRQTSVVGADPTLDLRYSRSIQEV